MGREAELRARLYRLAMRIAFPGPVPDVDQAIRLACELLTLERDTPATIDVAALHWGTAFRDAEPLIRDMLGQQQVLVPEPGTGQPELLGFLLRAFADGCLAWSEIWHRLLDLLPRWQDQGQAQRELMRLALELEQDTSPAGTAETIAAMRAAAASAIAQLPLRFKVETAFRITGRGTVIAGVIEQGTLRIADELELVQLASSGRAETQLTRCISIEVIAAPRARPMARSARRRLGLRSRTGRRLIRWLAAAPPPWQLKYAGRDPLARPAAQARGFRARCVTSTLGLPGRIRRQARLCWSNGVAGGAHRTGWICACGAACRCRCGSRRERSSTAPAGA